MVKINDKSFMRYMRSKLFSEDFLENHLEDLDEYKSLDEVFLKERFKEISSLYKEDLKRQSEAQLESNFLQPIFKSLGHIFEVQTSKKSEETEEGTKRIDYAFFYAEDDKAAFHKNTDQKNAIKYSSCSTICESKSWGLLDNHDKALKNDNTDPIWQIKKSYLDQINPKEQKATVPFGILTDGKSWRIYSYRAEMDKFFELNLEEIIKNKDFDRFKTFWFFFSKDAFRGKSYLSLVEAGSKKLQSQVSDELRKQVYLSLELIATGLFRVYNSRDREWDEFKKYQEMQTFLEEKSLDEVNIDNPEIEKLVLEIIYSESLVYLFRVLFLLYADHRKLFEHPKVKNVFYNLLEKIESYSQIGNVPENAESIRDKNDDYDINDVFKEIDDKFNGGLFSTKLHPILNKFDIDNVLYANAIDYLTRTFDKKTQKPQRVDFSVLEVRHLGTIYEGLLEYKLKSATEEKEEFLLGDRKKKRKLLKGDLYLVNDKGERKASGSYYTPDYIVESIVKYTVGPLVDEIVKKESGPSDKIKEILNIRVLDPAMGSAHFLVEVISYINDRIEDLIQAEIEEITRKSNRRTKTLQDLENLLKGAEEGKYKRMIAKRCIYGVDKNPMAVELAKLSIWIFTLQKNQKLEFFDYNLRCGDSLIGSQEKTFSGRIDSKTKEMMLFANNEDLYKNVIENFKEEFKKYFEFENVDEKKQYYESTIKPNQQKLRYLANIELALAFADKNDEIHSIYSAQKNKLLQIIRLDQKNEYIKGLNASMFFSQSTQRSQRQEFKPSVNSVSSVRDSSFEDWELKLFRAAKKIEDNYNPIHWELDFPNVFIERGGFDAVVGNPPYVRARAFSAIEKNYFLNNYKVAENQFDLFHLFIEKAVTESNRNSLLSFIVPNTFLANENTKELRKFILESINISKIIDCGKNVFEEANVESLIFTFRKGMVNASEYFILKNRQFLFLHQFNASSFINNKNYNFVVTLPSKGESVSSKIKKQSGTIADYFDVTTGIKEYQVGKGNPPQTEEDKESSRFNSNTKLNESYKPELRGRNIVKYGISWDNEYISYGPWVAEPRDSTFFDGDKLLIRQIPAKNSLIVSFTDKYFVVDQTVYIAKQKSLSNLKILYVLAVLNSKLMFWFFRNENNEFDVLFPKIKTKEFKSLPIKNISPEAQAPFIRLADIMLSKNKELQEIQKKFTKLLVSEFKLDKLSEKLENWYLLDWSEFAREVGKKKIVLSAVDEEKWLDRFERLQKEALAIKAVIDSTDKGIDLMVYRLYDLTFDEVKIVDPEFSMNKKDYESYSLK